MFVTTSKEMKQIDMRAIEKYKIPSIMLMENAAYAVLEEIIKLNPQKILIVCGAGNNGGDGFALARLLYIRKYDIEVFCFHEEDKIKDDAKTNYDILKKIGVEIKNDLDELKLKIEYADIVVDAILGTGLKGEVKEETKKVIEIVNRGKFIISIDIPSGINSDNGKKMGSCVNANITVTFECKKYGHVLGEGREASGRVYVKKISIPDNCILDEGIKTITNDEFYPIHMIKKRKLDTNKGDYGKVYIIGGSHSMSGALILATKAAIKMGSGLVYGVFPKSIIDRVGSIVPEIVNIPCEEKDGLLDINYEKLDMIIQNADAIAIGIGLGRSEELRKLIEYILNNYKGVVVLDADGLNNIASCVAAIKRSKSKIIITPHPGEMARLTGLEVDYINNNRIEVAKDFAKEFNCIVLLKGASTVVTDGDVVYINTTGNPGMATAGSGDVLTGIIVSLLGQGYNPFESAILGSYLHGLAGDEAYIQCGYGLSATDIIEKLGKFLRF